MPGFDRTGPSGAGPMSGGRRGFCVPPAAGATPYVMGNYVSGRGLGSRRGFRGRYGSGRGMGRGYAWDFGWYPSSAGPLYPADARGEINALKAQAANLQNTLAAISKRISEIEQDIAEES